MNRSAIISTGGKKRKDVPGLYFEVDCEKVRIYGGVYMPDKDQLTRIREEISFNMKAFDKIINESEFKSTFGDILGEKNVRIPKEFHEAGEQQELIYNKQFYWFAEYSTDVALRDEFPQFLANHYKIMKPISDFFEKPVLG